MLLIAGFVGWKWKGANDDGEIRALRAELGTAAQRLKFAHEQYDDVAKQLNELRDKVAHQDSVIAELQSTAAIAPTRADELLTSNTPHSTQKPVECMRRPMQNNSGPGDAVYDPFLGSGTSLIAAETLKRVCFGMELEPRFVDVAIRRWQAFTGRDATLLGKEQTFRDVANERQASKT